MTVTMNVTFRQTVMAVSIAAVLAVFTVCSVMHIRQIVHANSKTKDQTSDRVHAVNLYKLLELANFAQKDQEEVNLARNDWKWEYGSVVNVGRRDCRRCVLFVKVLRRLLQKESTQDKIVKFSTEVCINLEIESERVCTSIVEQFKAEFFGVLLRLADMPKEVCSYVLGDDWGGEPFDPKAMWNITFPNVPKPPVVPPILPKPGSPTLRILHLTDLHMDTEYTTGTNADCGEPLCCRADNGPPAPGVAGAGKYGDYGDCDTVPITVDSLFQHLNSTQDEFDYVVFTGDISPHNVWNQSRQDQTTAMEVFTEYAKKYLPNKLVFSTLGNHESAPVNSFPPPFITGNDSGEWLYTAAADSWLNWLPNDTEATIKIAGYYSTKPYPGLRIISLNTNMCNRMNWWLYINTTDPADMLQWLISELQDAENAGDKVHVIGHIYPGSSECLKSWSWNYYKIVNRSLSCIIHGSFTIYRSCIVHSVCVYCSCGLRSVCKVTRKQYCTIVEHFFGHTHANYYGMFYDEETLHNETLQRPVGVTYLPGSITTYSKFNPGFRIYEVDGNYSGSSWRVQDYTNYFLNLTHANMYDEAVWQKEYAAKEAYGMSSVFPEDWNQLIYRMKDDDTLFQKFCGHRYKSAPNDCSTCTGKCKKDLLCDLKTGRSEDPDICQDLYQ